MLDFYNTERDQPALAALVARCNALLGAYIGLGEQRDTISSMMVGPLYASTGDCAFCQLYSAVRQNCEVTA